jgi:hypothetical protein
MDNLKFTASDFYKGREQYTRAMKKQPMLDEGGRKLVEKACERKHIQEAKKHSFMRRTYSDAYIHRCEDGKTVTLLDFDQLGARWVKDCNDVSSRIDHNGWYTNGWYTDSLEGEMLIGVVLCFARHGAPDLDSNGYEPKEKAIYMAGTRHSDRDGVTLDLSTTDDPITAARWADSMAERAAEECREEDEKYHAEQKAAECREEIAAARKKCLALLRDMRPIRKGMSVPESVVQALVERVQGYLEDIANWRQSLDEMAT